MNTTQPSPDVAMPPEDEEALVRRAQANDRGARAILVERYWDRVHRWLYHLCRDPHQADDLTQETFLRALANLHRFEAGTCLAAWLFRIGHNVATSQIRKPNRTQPLPAEVVDPGDGPSEQAAVNELSHRIDDAIARLAPDFRGAFLLRVQEGLSFREIAQVMGLTEETARWRVFKARQKLLELVGVPGAEEENDS